MIRHQVGIGWRPALAASIFSHLNSIDVVEIVADNYFDAPQSDLRSLRTLRTQVPVVLHAVSLGLSSTVRCNQKRIEKLARLIDIIQPQFWSEHLAFVRGGGIEIGHLAAPPRNATTLDGTLQNIELARMITGSYPQMENVATLIDPPGSTFTEVDWILAYLKQSPGKLLLDLHNLYANALNFQWDPFELIQRIPIDKIGSIHIAGGKWIGTKSRSLLDDHCHEVPDPVYEMITKLSERSSNPLTLILERDGNFPDFAVLLQELSRAKDALNCGFMNRERGVA